MLLLGAIGFALAPLVVVASSRRGSGRRSKGDTYECGLLTTGETWVRFRIQYYIYALMFVVFDIETVFLYPWAVELRRAWGCSPWSEMVVFLVDPGRRPGLRLGQGRAASGSERSGRPGPIEHRLARRRGETAR